jgi:hypothetical protein
MLKRKRIATDPGAGKMAANGEGLTDAAGPFAHSYPLGQGREEFLMAGQRPDVGQERTGFFQVARILN